MYNLIKLFAFALILGVALFSVPAFASSHSGVEISGEGVSQISGWVVSNVSYQLAENPSQVKSVSFDLNAPAGYVSVKMVSNSMDFSTCSNRGGYHWQCDLHANVTISSMDEFRVVATGN